MKEKLKVLDLFSGIGGFSLGLERTGGFETVAFCEIEKFPQKVLKKHWPDVPIYEDVRELNGQEITDKHGRIDVITGGFPCQDLSTAGTQGGLEAERSGLWSEIVRLTSELRPKYIIVENVANLLSGPSSKPGGWFGRILGDLAEIGYDAEWEDIPACALGYPHIRERVWIVAYPQQERWEGVLSRLSRKFNKTQYIEDKKAASLDTSRYLDQVAKGNVDGEPPIFLAADGIPQNMDELGAVGNTIIPQIPELIGNAILESEKQNAGHARNTD